MNNEISNPQQEVEITKEMNDENYLNAELECMKNMSNNFNVALNEMSNEFLYQKVYPMFENIRKMQRELFELAFRKGWYTLEKVEDEKITKTINKLEQKIQELI